MINEPYKSLFQNKAEVRKLTDKIFQEGAVCLPNFFDQETYDLLLAYSHSLGDEERLHITFRPGTPAMNVAQSDDFMRVFDEIHRARCEIEGIPYSTLKPSQQAVSMPMRYVATKANPLHFDDSFVNAVYALKMPSDKREGHLQLYNSFRKHIRPLFFSRVAARLLRHSAFLRSIIKPKEIQYQERALHIFFGDLSLHGVPAISGGERLSFTLNAHRGHIPN